VSDRNSNRVAADERGFTFLVVIWGLSILIVLSLVFGATVSAHLKTTRNAIDNARAEAFADAGIQLALLDLSAWRGAAGREARFPRTGRPVRCSLGNDDWLSVAVEDEAGKVDLNAAGAPLISAALLAAGAAEDATKEYAQRIIDYRDDDNDRQQLGAEREEYRDEGRAGPKNAPFDTIEEIEQVFGMPIGIAEALRPYATVYSGEQSIDGNFAARRLLSALSNSGLGLAVAEEFSMLNELGERRQPTGLVTAAGGRVFRVLAQARTAEGAVFLREAVVEFIANRPGAYVFRRWRKGTVPAESQTDSLLDFAPPPC
jgi:general secretion pathway protein K